jgi:hypothetical protein
VVRGDKQKSGGAEEPRSQRQFAGSKVQKFARSETARTIGNGKKAEGRK